MSDEKNSSPFFDDEVNEEYYKLLHSKYVSNIDIEDETKDTDITENIQSDNLNTENDTPTTGKESKKFFRKIADWFNALPKKKKIIVSIVAVILCISIVLGSIVISFVIKKFSIMGDDFDSSDDVIYEDEKLSEIKGDVGAAGFNDALKAWAVTGNDSIMTSKNVINVLLIGADSRYGTNSGNTDSMILVSLNKKTKQIKLISFFRDSFLYIENNGNGCFNKLNAAYSVGGAQCLLRTIENNYKIDIDNFVMVNFESFKAIIDSMGGVSVDVQKYEADYIKKRYKIELPIGENVKLSGKQALIFCRTRGCDSDADVSRTRRQRQVINAIMDRVKTASLSDLNKYIDTLLPYVYTGYSKTDILSLGMKAITGGWAKYERSQLQMPSEDARDSGYAGNAWIWVVDYQLAAHQLQNEIYGTSNIILEDGRKTLIDVYRGRSATGTSGSGKSAVVQETKATADTTVYSADNNKETTAVKNTTEANTTELATSSPSNTERAPKTEPVTEAETTVSEPETVISTEPVTENNTVHETEKITEKQTEKLTESLDETIGE